MRTNSYLLQCSDWLFFFRVLVHTQAHISFMAIKPGAANVSDSITQCLTHP